MTLLNNKIRLSVTRKELRNNSTDTEKILWNYLKWSKFHWLKFRRQHSIDRYIVDFYCTKYKIAIEIDWNVHIDRQEYDDLRTEYLNACWIKIIRFTNDEIVKDIEKVLNKLFLFIRPPY